ncbi:MAG: hypothetical protein B2I17_10045 [Thermoplasmatales archaeon B_DKE]|nr:MAG: hypothetical protein B2I17_10045 [Thermoplasmatales archaeon B_DKE]
MINGNWEIKISTQGRVDIAKQAMAYLHEYAPRIRAIRIKAREKVPLELDWTSRNNYPVNSEVVLKHVQKGGNYGIAHPSGLSCAIDGDTPKIRAAALSLGDTMEWNTGTPGHYCEVFLIKDAPIGNIPLVDGAYIRGKGGQNLGPGSIHPNGNVYGAELLHLVPPVMVTKAELLEVFRSFIVGTEKLDNAPKSTHKGQNAPASLLMKDLVDVASFKQIGSAYQGSHPVHGSETGSNFRVDLDQNVWHCFRHGTGGGPLQWIAVSTGVISCEESVPGKVKGDLFWEVIAAAHNQYGLSYEALVKALGGN